MAKKLAFDKWLFTVVILLTLFGLVMVYSASTANAWGRGVNPFLFKQALAAALGLMLMAVVMHLDYAWLRRQEFVYGVLGVTVALLVAVLFLPSLNNVHRWVVIGGLSFQPSELAKVAMVLYLAYQIHRKRETLNQLNCLLPCAVVMGLISGLILIEDLGTGGLLLATGGLLLFLAGLSWRIVAGAAMVLVPVLVISVVAVPYRMKRVFSFLDPDADRLGSGFQVSQSLIAVGSGGWHGLGPGQSMQKLYFLPHPESDFIFSIICEELGLLGALAVLALFGVLMWRGLRAGRRAPDDFGTYLAWGLTALLGIQALSHVSVALALLPATGVPLPFISYGGSSLVVTLIISGLLLNVSQHS